MDATEVVKEVTRVLRLMFGQEKVPNPTASHITRWGSDPYAKMSWTFFPPHCSEKHCEELSKPFGRYRGDLQRVRFAGEATESDDIGTVHGAWLTGEREAIAILEEWVNDESDSVWFGAGYDVEVELEALKERAKAVDELREENEESSSSEDSDDSCSSDDY